MANEQRKTVPVNIISGPLGVGKTTLIKKLLEQRPEDERWAVLVNEFGLVGLDASMMQDSARPQVEIREVAGGCICCTAGFLFDMYLVLLLQRRPDRLLIEPTGLAKVTGILETLGRPGIAEAVDLRASLCLLDIRDYAQQREDETVRNQIDTADILLGSRSELVSPNQSEAFEHWAQALRPAKQHVGRLQEDTPILKLLDCRSKSAQQTPDSSVHGHAPADHLDLSSPPRTQAEEKQPCTPAEPILPYKHRSKVAVAQGWRCLSTLRFHEETLTAWLSGLANTNGCLRVKGVMHTSEGWILYNFTRTSQEISPTSSRKESRLEFLFDPEQAATSIEQSENKLRSLLRS